MLVNSLWACSEVHLSYSYIFKDLENIQILPVRFCRLIHVKNVILPWFLPIQEIYNWILAFLGINNVSGRYWLGPLCWFTLCGLVVRCICHVTPILRFLEQRIFLVTSLFLEKNKDRQYIRAEQLSVKTDRREIRIFFFSSNWQN